MKHTRFIWLAFLTCAAVVGAAMAVITNHALALEKARVHAAGEAALGEKVRLALWRMDTAAAALLFAENNRGPSEFHDVAASNSQVERAAAIAAAPPLGGMPDDAILRFEINESGQVSCPQVAANPLPNLAQVGEPQQAQVAERAAALLRLRELLGLGQDPPAAPVNPNYQMAVAAANMGLPNTQVGAPPTDPGQQASANAVSQQQGQGLMPGNPATYQSNKEQAATLNEYNSRQALMQRAIQSNSTLSQQSIVSDPRPVPPASAAPVQVTPYKALWLEGELFLVRAVVDGAGSRVQGVWLRTCALSNTLLATLRDLLPNATLTPFQPFVFSAETVLKIGAAANSNSLSSLAASFTAKANAYDHAPLALVTLPWQLVPGEAPRDPPLTWSPLHTLLAVAWGCVALAMLAVAVLLGGVVSLSERRASFVSSVTHELRTPLTTFRLYSEMLADDMIPDPDHRKAYLQTLQTEASRLSHLVENVLAYSRIERGSARARIEHTSVGSLVSRLSPRLAERAAAATMQLNVEMPDTLSNIGVALDVTAVEQILFNLVDNACKYATSDAPHQALTLSISRSNNMLHLRLRDHGPGISPGTRKHLFKPFHKSAQQAASSKPGVGLGLALSRRLARALGGNLSLESTCQPGTCFLLELPIT
jgi:signal transduction histidine kinase